MARAWIPYHCKVKVFSRGGSSSGASALAAGSYRHGTQLVKVSSSQSVAAYRHGIDMEGKGDTDFSRKQHVIKSDLILPEDAPAWAHDRQELYNRIEAVEDKSTRPKTAQLLREIEVMIPRELWEHDRGKAIATVHAFAERQAKTWGTFADVAIHCPKGKDGWHPHAHILFGLRPLTADGFGDKSGERARYKLDNALRATIAGLKKAGQAIEAVALSRDLTVNKIRASWERDANEALADINAAGRIDRRSLEAQKIEAREQGRHGLAAWLDRVPQKPIGLVRRLGRGVYERARERMEAVALSQHRQQTRAPSLATGGPPRGKKRRSLRQSVGELARNLERGRTPALERGPALER